MAFTPTIAHYIANEEINNQNKIYYITQTIDRAKINGEFILYYVMDEKSKSCVYKLLERYFTNRYEWDLSDKTTIIIYLKKWYHILIHGA